MGLAKLYLWNLTDFYMQGPCQTKYHHFAHSPRAFPINRDAPGAILLRHSAADKVASLPFFFLPDSTPSVSEGGDVGMVSAGICEVSADGQLAACLRARY